jgi:hypothetical protein
MGRSSEAARDRWRWRDDPVSDESSAAKKIKLDAEAEAHGLAAVVDAVLTKWSRHPLSWRRQAAGIWLVSILKYCSESRDLQPRLHRIQGSFSNLLAEGDDFAQDVASKGLGILYDIGDEETKAALVQVAFCASPHVYPCMCMLCFRVCVRARVRTLPTHPHCAIAADYPSQRSVFGLLCDVGVGVDVFGRPQVHGPEVHQHVRR